MSDWWVPVMISISPHGQEHGQDTPGAFKVVYGMQIVMIIQ